VAAGTIVAVVGANGAGKSTLLKVLSGLVRPGAGEIAFGGRRLDRLGPPEIVRLGVAHVPERRQVFAEQTVADNLRLGAYTAGLDGRGLDRRIDEITTRFPALRERLHDHAAALSGGQQQMLAIARGLMLRPRLLMLDEPSLGLAPLVVREIFEIVRQLRGEGVALLLVEQNARAALAIADRAYVLESGAVALSGSGRELLDDEAVVERYLGIGPARETATSPRAAALRSALRGILGAH
jgi:branched-chain amino acid transport system ATP-binding protein